MTKEVKNMAKKVQTINMNLRSSSTCPARRDAFSLLDSHPDGEKLNVKIDFEMTKDKSRYIFYLEEILPEKKFAEMKRDSLQADTALEAALDKRGKATVFLTGRNSNMISAVIEFQPFEEKVKTLDASIFEQEIDRIVHEGIDTTTKCEKAISIMKAHRFPDELILLVLKYWDKFEKPIREPETVYIDTEPHSKEPSILAKAAVEVLCHHHLIFEGDKSVGKNMCAETLAYIMHMPYDMITMTRGMSGDELYGTKVTDASAASHLTPEMAEAKIRLMQGTVGMTAETTCDLAAQFDYWSAKAASISIVQEISSFVYALQHGGIFCLNEMNLADANFLASFVNQATDGSGFLTVPGIGRVDIHPKFVLIGTQNAEYTGTCEQNEATISRMCCIQFPYPASIKDQLIAASKVKDKLNDQYFTQADNLYKGYLAAVRKGDVENTCLNIRGMVRALQSIALVPGFMKLSQAIVTNVINTCPEDDRKLLTAQLNELVTL